MVNFHCWIKLNLMVQIKLKETEIMLNIFQREFAILGSIFFLVGCVGWSPSYFVWGLGMDGATVMPVLEEIMKFWNFLHVLEELYNYYFQKLKI